MESYIKQAKHKEAQEKKKLEKEEMAQEKKKIGKAAPETRSKAASHPPSQPGTSTDVPVAPHKGSVATAMKSQGLYKTSGSSGSKKGTVTMLLRLLGGHKSL